MIVFASLKAFAKVRHRLDADVHARMSRVRELNRNRLRDNLASLHRFVTIDHLMIRRQQATARLTASQRCLICDAVCKLIVFDQRLADGEAFGFQKRVGHRAANQQPIDFAIDERVDHRNLVRDFGAAEDCDEWMLRILNDAAEILEFLFHQQTGRRLARRTS